MLSVRKLLNESVFQPQTGSFQNVARSRRTSAWCTCLKRANNGLFHHFLYFFLSRCFFFFVNLFGLENGPVFFFLFFFRREENRSARRRSVSSSRTLIVRFLSRGTHVGGSRPAISSLEALW